MTIKDSRQELIQKLNRETGKIEWQALENHQRQEAVVFVNAELDLITVAVELAEDNSNQIAQWLADNSISKVTAEQAKEWQEANKHLWAVVIAPWILVQEIKD